ncbi:Brp/Blh family beta-carotene 15,15'-dioxygenase [Subtercola boreus]|uniref:Brp/Blh family beta-carotene 15,15'-dioxygenase n=1 Tax=Subtercola boreus TaxID=120213 RepID=UPI00155968E5|nr:Brp/Blh family beta-carotene 15,15'-dioxygenase [Subtercola boreus]
MRTPGGDLAVWQLARRQLFLPVGVLFACLSIVSGLGVQIPELVQLLPFAVGLIVLGLPHGALDHLVPARLAGRPATWRTIAPVVVLYGVLGAVVLGLWWAAPGLAFVFFIGLTWFHWGQGDLFVVTRWRQGAEPDPGSPRLLTLQRAADAATLVLRGALPMLVPLVAFPQTYLATAASAANLFAPAGATPESATSSWTVVTVAALTSESGRVAIAVVLGAGVLGTIILTRLQVARVDGEAAGSRLHIAGLRAWRWESIETLVLAVFFSTVPPVLAVGLYFCLWHSLRHVVRLCLLDEALRAPLAEGRFPVAFARFTRQAAPVTLIALALLVALYALVPHPEADPTSLLGLYLVLISALTLPHVVIVALMDRVQERGAKVAASGMIALRDRA